MEITQFELILIDLLRENAPSQVELFSIFYFKHVDLKEENIYNKIIFTAYHYKKNYETRFSAVQIIICIYIYIYNSLIHACISLYNKFKI